MMASEYDLDEESGGSETSSIGEPVRPTIGVRATVVNPEFPKKHKRVDASQ